jgi:glutathione S-transferase
MYQVSGKNQKPDPICKYCTYLFIGQGPYFGQLTFFARFHPEKIPSVIERYTQQTEMVFEVLDKALQNRKWLVGDKCTYADLSFVTWSHVAKGMLQELGKELIMKRYPRYTAWLETMESRQPVRDCLTEIVTGRIAHGLPA